MSNPTNPYRTIIDDAYRALRKARLVAEKNDKHGGDTFTSEDARALTVSLNGLSDLVDAMNNTIETFQAEAQVTTRGNGYASGMWRALESMQGVLDSQVDAIERRKRTRRDMLRDLAAINEINQTHRP